MFDLKMPVSLLASRALTKAYHDDLATRNSLDGLALTFAYPVADLTGDSMLYAPPSPGRVANEEYAIWAELE